MSVLNKKLLPVVFLALLLPLSIIRAAQTLIRSWSDYQGDLLMNFPFYFLLDKLNPALYHSLINACTAPWQPFFPETWFYAPVHHLWLAPFLFIFDNILSFYRFLLVFYSILLLVIFRFLHNEIKREKNWAFSLAFLTITLGSCQLIENLWARNVELLILIFIVLAYAFFKKRREYTAGSLLCCAFMAKLFPFIFFPYLVVKKQWKAVIAFVFTLVIIISITQMTLGWQKYELFNIKTAKGHGLITPERLLGKECFFPLSFQGVSLYCFILQFFADVDFPEITYKIDNFLLPNLIFLLLISLIVGITFYLFYKTKRNGNTLHEFSIVSLLMLLIFPRTNPYYYVFALPSLLVILGIFSYNIETFAFSRWKQVILFLIYLFSLLSLGNLIPFRVYQLMLPPEDMVYHYFSVYSLYSVGTLVLWGLMLWFYWKDYKIRIG